MDKRTFYHHHPDFRTFPDDASEVGVGIMLDADCSATTALGNDGLATVCDLRMLEDSNESLGDSESNNDSSDLLSTQQEEPYHAGEDNYQHPPSPEYVASEPDESSYAMDLNYADDPEEEHNDCANLLSIQQEEDEPYHAAEDNNQHPPSPPYVASEPDESSFLLSLNQTNHDSEPEEEDDDDCVMQTTMEPQEDEPNIWSRFARS